MKEGDMLERSYKYLDTDMPCVPFSFGNTQNQTVVEDQDNEMDSVDRKEKDIVRSHQSSFYHNQYLTETRKSIIESKRNSIEREKEEEE